MNQRFLSQKPEPIFKLIFCGDEKCAPSHEYGGLRTHILIHVVVSGKGTFYWGKKSWNLSPGDAFIIFPDEKHLYKADSEDPWHYFWIGLDKSLLPFLQHKRISQEKPILFTENAADLYRLYRILFAGINENRTILEMEQYAIAYRILANLLMHHENRTPISGAQVKTDHPQSMIEFINSNFQTSISVEDVISYVKLERTYASKLFKEKTGYGIAGYIRNKRLEKSKEYLVESFSVKQAAYSVGFQGYENYLKAFKRAYGETPGNFQSRMSLSL